MANFVQQVARAGWLPATLLFLAPAASGEFSHRIHLAQKIDCVVCHSGAPSSTQAADNLLPETEVCLSCHTGDRKLAQQPAIKTPRSLLVSRFNHQLHLKMGNLAPVILRAIETKKYLSDPGNLAEVLAGVKHPCVACHRGLERSDVVTAAAFPQMADCLVCHDQVDPPFSCTKCHEEDARLKPASHTPDWIDVHSSGKANLDKPSCVVCHGRRFTCLGCH